jgi:hypothetical protein
MRQGKVLDRLPPNKSSLLIAYLLHHSLGSQTRNKAMSSLTSSNNSYFKV